MIYSSISNVARDHPHVKRSIREFEERGRSGPHSPAGAILCHIMNHCIENSVAFSLHYLPGGGYELQKKNFSKDLCALDLRASEPISDDASELMAESHGGDEESP